MAPILGMEATISDKIMMHDEVSKQIMIEKIECQQDCCRYSAITVNGEVETSFEGTDAESSG
jgi:hypothetical protein